MRLAPGTAVSEKLKLVRPIGAGAMGSVWVAHHAGAAKPVAVKFLAVRPDRAALARFQREASAASRIDSPNVVSILEHGTTDDGTPFIVMEFLEGETLGERLARVGRLPLDDTAAIVRQVAYAIDAAHRQGVIHRDIKPDNIFLVGSDDFPLVKVLDFGTAKETRSDGDGEDEGELTQAGVAVGTPEYMSPEQLLAGKDVDGQSDVWSLGVVAYRALAGVSPFKGDSPHAMFFAICRGAYSPLSEVGIPAEFEDWFRLALSPKKATRFPNARALVDAFDRAIESLHSSGHAAPFAGDDEEEDGATAFFDASAGVFERSGVLEAGPASSTTNPVWRPLEESVITAKNPRAPELLEAIERSERVRGSSPIAEWIAESMNASASAAPPSTAATSGLFERPSQRGGAPPAIIDDLASLEESHAYIPPERLPSPPPGHTSDAADSSGLTMLFDAIEEGGGRTVILDAEDGANPRVAVDERSRGGNETDLVGQPRAGGSMDSRVSSGADVRLTEPEGTRPVEGRALRRVLAFVMVVGLIVAIVAAVLHFAP